MPNYRLYCLDGAGHIGLADWIEAETNDEAIRQARALRPDANICELWHKDKLIARIDHDGRTIPAG